MKKTHMETTIFKIVNLEVATGTSSKSLRCETIISNLSLKVKENMHTANTMLLHSVYVRFLHIILSITNMQFEMLPKSEVAENAGCGFFYAPFFTTSYKYAV